MTVDYLGDVSKMQRAIGVETPHGLAIRRAELRAKLIEEEAKETADALRRGDLVEAIDGLMDLLVVAFGTIDEMDFDPTPFWNEVQRTNMAKAAGPLREDGKRLKPPGWTPPDIAGILKRLQRPTRVVNIRNEPAEVYIGRGSKWGNPFTHLYPADPALTIVGSRDEAIRRYEEWVKGDPALMAQLPELRGRSLGCYCKPLACHGDVLVRLADET